MSLARIGLQCLAHIDLLHPIDLEKSGMFIQVLESLLVDLLKYAFFQKGETRGSVAGRVNNDRDKRPVKAGSSNDESADISTNDKSSFLDKWTATGEYDKVSVIGFLSFFLEPCICGTVDDG